jgi:hypothetical protein
MEERVKSNDTSSKNSLGKTFGDPNFNSKHFDLFDQHIICRDNSDY